MMVDRFTEGPRAHSYLAGKETARRKVTLVKLSKGPMATFFEGPTVADLIEDAARHPPFDLKLVAASFSLTPAEIRLSISLREAASEFGIAEGTARHQLKSIFRKTGTSRQSELIVWMRGLRSA